MMQDYLVDKVTEAGMDPKTIQEVYADGWDEIPSGLAELTRDAKLYSLIILYSLEGVELSDIETIVNSGCDVYCAMTPYAGTVASMKSNGAKALQYTIQARDYYKELRSLNIKVGMKQTRKHVGNVPYGYTRSDTGTLEEVPNEIQIVNQVRDLYVNMVPVVDIATRFNLTTRQVYGVMAHLGYRVANRFNLNEGEMKEPEWWSIPQKVCSMASYSDR